MKKRVLFFLTAAAGTRKSSLRGFGSLGLIAAVLLFAACAKEDANSGGQAAGTGQVQAGDSFHPDTVKAFRDAGLSLLRQKVTPRDFSLPVISPGSGGETQSLGGLKGKVTLLNFWATWCGPCRAEMPSMEALYRSYKDRGFEILAVNSGETEPDVLAFMERNSLSFPVVLDEGGKTSAAYGIRAIPTSFLLDKEGKIILRAVGSLDWNAPQFRAALERLL